MITYFKSLYNSKYKWLDVIHIKIDYIFFEIYLIMCWPKSQSWNIATILQSNDEIRIEYEAENF